MTRSKSLLFLFALLAFIFNANGQYAESIRSGRPGLAIGPFTTGKGVVQNQSGFYNSFAENVGTTNQTVEGNTFSTVFRVGLTEQFELGCSFSYADLHTQYTGLTPDDNVTSRQEGINLFTLAMRVNITEGKGLRPAFGYQVNLGLPWVSGEFEAEYVAPKITLMTAQSFEHFRFITNWAGTWNGNNAEPSATYMLFLDRGFGKKIRIFFEHYGIIQGETYTPKFDGGLLYLVNKDIQLDLQYGNGPFYKNTTHDYFITLGVAWRVRWIERP